MHHHSFMAEFFRMDTKGLHNFELQLRNAIEQNPHDYRSLTELAGVLLGDTYRQYGEAEQLARQAIAADPTAARAYAELATALARQQRLDELDVVLQEAARRAPEDTLQLFKTAIILFESATDAPQAVASKVLPQAEKYLRRYLAQSPAGSVPSPAIAHWKLALVLEKQGRTADAIAEIHAAAIDMPNNFDFHRDYKRLAG